MNASMTASAFLRSKMLLKSEQKRNKKSSERPRFWRGVGGGGETVMGSGSASTGHETDRAIACAVKLLQAQISSRY